MKQCAVIGGGFGDCGKGLVVDYLCSQFKNPLVIRFSGGHQAGHNVVFNGVRHIFSSFGSGTLRGAPTYFSKFCTISPIAIYNEYMILKDKGITPKLYIDKDCPVITPYDKQDNIEKDQTNKHGTCGIGFGATIEREENNYHLVAGDLLYPSVLDIKLNQIKKWYGTDNQLYTFYDSYKWLMNNENIQIVDRHIFESSFLFDAEIYEGSQGLLLDKDIGFFPNVTRSNTGTKNVLELCNNPDVYVVTRAYQTRHGNGEMTNTNIPHNIKINPFETNISNQYQGDFRISLLDVDLLQYGIDKDNIKFGSLVITCLDHIVNEYRFTYKGKIINCNDEDDFVKRIANILKFRHVYTNNSDESKTMKYRYIL